MADKLQFGKWRVEKTLKRNRVYLATSENQKGVVKTGDKIDFEAEVLIRLNHPNIITLLDHDLRAETPYIVTEYHVYESPSFNDLNDWDTRKKCDFFDEYCQAVAYCHQQGIAKGDHKLANVVLDKDSKPIIIDFGGSSKLYNKSGINSEMLSLAMFFWEIMEGKCMAEFLHHPNINSQYQSHRERYLQRKATGLKQELDDLKSKL